MSSARVPLLLWSQLEEPFALDLLCALGYTRKAATQELARKVTSGERLPKRISFR